MPTLPFETDFDLLPVSAGVVELDGTIIAWNAAAAALLERPRSQIIGRKAWEFAPGGDLLWPEIVKGTRERGEYRGDIMLATPHGPRSVHYVFALRTFESRPLLVLCALEYDPNKEAAPPEDHGAEQRLEALGLVAGGIAHDFNNQLVSVLAEASAAAEDPQLSETARDSLRRIEASANRMAMLTRQLLAYAGRGRFVSELVDPDDLLRQSRDQLAHGLADGIELVVEPAAGPVAIHADRSLLAQLIGNLVVNAAEAHTGPGRIDIATSAIAVADGPPRWQLQMRDRGTGMDPDTIARIWDPFFTTKPNHHGLGLSAAVGIVRRLGGEISVESRPGTGATFTLRLPIVSGAKAQSQPAAMPAPMARQRRATSLRGMRALIADDEPSVRTTIRRLLERREAIVVLASDGAEAKALLVEGTYHFIVLDVMMPGLTGYQLVPFARTAQPKASVLLMSGFTDIARDPGGEEADAFLEKPFTSKSFEDAIDDLVRKR